MNLDRSPTKEELKSLLSSADDEAGNHLVWVSRSGDVHIDVVPHDLTPLGYSRTLMDQQFRLEALAEGAGYVGLEAAADDEWVDDLFAMLMRHWDSEIEGFAG